jgi:hypothetical protein
MTSPDYSFQSIRSQARASGKLNLYNSDDSFSEKYTYKYSYDSHGNWIELINSGDTATEITEHTIEYYEG